jgi:archaetidylinositol phosphate synthase
MLDTHCRRWIQPPIDRIARVLVRLGVSALAVTVLALVIGVAAGALAAAGRPILAAVALWASGFLDVLDGSMARIAGRSSSWGSLLDITFDQIVELSVVVGLAVLHPEAQLALLVLAAVLLVSMTVFLTVGALVRNQGFKAFYFQPGLIERSEEILFLTAMLLVQDRLLAITLAFAGAKLLTTLLRLRAARRLFASQGR